MSPVPSVSGSRIVRALERHGFKTARVSGRRPILDTDALIAYERAAAQARALAAIESVVDVLAYTDTTAAHHARLIAHVRRTGAPCGAHDRIIAAHAAETGRTTQRAHRNVGSGVAPR
jgi:hypothetical protein